MGKKIKIIPKYTFAFFVFASIFWCDISIVNAEVARPKPRFAHAKANDSGRDRVIVFGGAAAAVGQADMLKDTWEWDGRQWLLISDSGPPKRAAYGMLWDHQRKTVLLYGGTNIQARYSELWE
jgi:hypothetical protein